MKGAHLLRHKKGNRDLGRPLVNEHLATGVRAYGQIQANRTGEKKDPIKESKVSRKGRSARGGETGNSARWGPWRRKDPRKKNSQVNGETEWGKGSGPHNQTWESLQVKSNYSALEVREQQKETTARKTRNGRRAHGLTSGLRNLDWKIVRTLQVLHQLLEGASTGNLIHATVGRPVDKGAMG